MVAVSTTIVFYFVTSMRGMLFTFTFLFTTGLPRPTLLAPNGFTDFP
nr:hypothetical protein Q903MT_gene3376 [Picea sitchensis]